MGLLGDLAMGFGLQDRDADYYERTAQTIGRTKGADREARYRASDVFTNQPARGGIGGMGSGGQRGGWGYGEGDRRVNPFIDMINGGGRGQAGQRFEGGLLAGIANALGIRPHGYQEQPTAAPSAPVPHAYLGASPMTSMRPQARPAQPMNYSGRGDYGMPSQPSMMPYNPSAPFGDPAYFYGQFMNTGLPPTMGNEAMQNYFGFGIPRSR